MPRQLRGAGQVPNAGRPFSSNFKSGIKSVANKLIDVDELEEFQPVLTSQMRPVELNGKQLLPLRHVLGLLRHEAAAGNARAVGLIQRLQASV